jgi:hypothetical protein
MESGFIVAAGALTKIESVKPLAVAVFGTGPGGGVIVVLEAGVPGGGPPQPLRQADSARGTTMAMIEFILSMRMGTTLHSLSETIY